MKEPYANQCHDCLAHPGALHEMWCDVERCPACGGQALGCFEAVTNDKEEVMCVLDCEGKLVSDDRRIPWTGEAPGYPECREFGWYSYFDDAKRDPRNNSPWQQCSPDHPQASPDLNRLYDSNEAVWSKELRRFVLREGSKADRTKEQSR